MGNNLWRDLLLGFLAGLIGGLLFQIARANAQTSSISDKEVESLVEEFLPEARYKIAVIDTGFDPARATTKVKLCKTGHWDALTKTSNLNFIHPHGTKVASILAEKLKDVDYCLVIFEVFTSQPKEELNVNFNDIARAFNDSVGLGVVAINASFDGTAPSKIERDAVENVSKVNIPVFVAAGNKGENLDVNCRYYPACYQFKNIVVVGSRDYNDPKKHASSSNWGQRVSIWAPAYYQGIEADDKDFGTSFATPRALAEYILFLEHKRLHPVKEKTKCLNRIGAQKGYCD